MTSGGQARSTEGAKVFYLSERRRVKQSARNEAARVEAFGLLGLPILQADVSPILRIGERAVSRTAAYLDLGTNTKAARALLELIQGIKRTESIEADSKGAWIAGPYNMVAGQASSVEYDLFFGHYSGLLSRVISASDYMLKISRSGAADSLPSPRLALTNGLWLTSYVTSEATGDNPRRWEQSTDPKIGSVVDRSLINFLGMHGREHSTMEAEVVPLRKYQ